MLSIVITIYYLSVTLLSSSSLKLLGQIESRVLNNKVKVDLKQNILRQLQSTDEVILQFN
jgi:hypothetical protein